MKITKELVVNTALAALAAFVGAFAFQLEATSDADFGVPAVVAAAYAGLRFAAGVVATAFGRPSTVD